MPDDRIPCAEPTHVRAVFDTSVAFFDISRIATFEELADRLCRLGEHHHNPLTRLEIRNGSLAAGRQALSKHSRRRQGIGGGDAGCTIRL